MSDSKEEIDLNNLSPSLIKYFNVDINNNTSNINKNIQTDWQPPKHHGLNNSFIIIPNYYKKPGVKILKVDYYDMIVHDIRNCRKLDDNQLNFIKNLDDDSKQKLFIEF
jgi:hypothetical protein